MLGLTVKPRSADDVARHLSLFSVGEMPQWVGNAGNVLYRPYTETVFDPRSMSSIILARTAFMTERPLVGSQNIIPESRLGQVAVLSDMHDNTETITAAIAIPYKTGWFKPIQEHVVYEPLEDEATVSATITDPTANLHRIVRNALFTFINSEPIPFK